MKKKEAHATIILRHESRNKEQIGHGPEMVYLLPPGGSFVDHDFLKAQCLRSILQHVSPLAVGALRCNNLL